MKRFLLVMVLSLGASSAVFAQSAAGGAPPAAAPATQDATAPEGLPPGHPPLPPKAGAEPTLPAGHPDIAGLAANGPVLQANILVVATQKTADGPAPTGDSVTLDVYAPNQAVQHLQAKLDDHGKASFSNISFRGVCQPLVIVKHGGVDFRAVGGTMDAEHAGQKIEISVFETTPQAPATSLTMRHLIVNRVDAGIQVTEMLDFNVPGDRAYPGNADAKDPHISLDFPLSPQITEVGIPRELRALGIDFAKGHLTDSTPLLPGEMQIQFAYVLPVKDGKAALDIAMPMAVGHMMLFTPDDGSTVTAPGFDDKGPKPMGKIKMHMFFGMGFPAGKNLQVNFSNLAAPPTTQAGAQLPMGEPADQPAPEREPAAPRWPYIAGGVSAAVVICGTIAILLRPAAKNAAKKG